MKQSAHTMILSSIQGRVGQSRAEQSSFLSATKNGMDVRRTAQIALTSHYVHSHPRSQPKDGFVIISLYWSAPLASREEEEIDFFFVFAKRSTPWPFEFDEIKLSNVNIAMESSDSWKLWPLTVNADGEKFDFKWESQAISLLTTTHPFIIFHDYLLLFIRCYLAIRDSTLWHRRWCGCHRQWWCRRWIVERWTIASLYDNWLKVVGEYAARRAQRMASHQRKLSLATTRQTHHSFLGLHVHCARTNHFRRDKNERKTCQRHGADTRLRLNRSSQRVLHIYDAKHVSLHIAR